MTIFLNRSFFLNTLFFYANCSNELQCFKKIFCNDYLDPRNTLLMILDNFIVTGVATQTKKKKKKKCRYGYGKLQIYSHLEFRQVSECHCYFF